MTKTRSLIILGVFYMVIFLALVNQLGMAQELAWETNPTPLPYPLENLASVAWNDTIYVIGGYNLGAYYGGEEYFNTVYRGTVQSDGKILEWTPATPLPEGRSGHRAVVWNKYVYVLGGNAPGGGQIERNTVWYTQINSDDSLGSWIATQSLPDSVSGHFAVVSNDRIYVGGGWTGFNWRNQVHYAEIQPDGSLGSWHPTTFLPEVRRDSAAAIHKGNIYVIGGQYPGNQYADTVYYAPINPNGSVGTWVTATQLPISGFGLTAVSRSDGIYIIGGEKGSTLTCYDTVFLTTPKEHGQINGWIKLPANLPEPISFHTSVVCKDTIYVIGGRDFPSGNKKYSDSIYFEATEIPPPPPPPDFQRTAIALTTGGSILAICITTIYATRAYSKKKNRKTSSSSFFIMR